MHHVHLVIHGRVQGVGFRYFVLLEARSLGLRGEVRNRPDGAVETSAEGERASLERFVEAVKRGPQAARVSNVDERWSEEATRYQGFEITG